MFKLTVVAGPNIGTSYALQEGEVTIGRMPGNVIVLPSNRVSKNHCKLIIGSTGVWVEDTGSSNGTFINGSQAKRKEVLPGDKISVGEFIFEVRRSRMRSADQAPAAPGFGNVIPFPTPAFPNAAGGQAPSAPSFDSAQTPLAPTDFFGKVRFFFESTVMPFFYRLNVHHEWRILSAAIFAAFLAINLLISVYPLLEGNRVTVLRESAKRAQALANALVEQNTGVLAASAETKTTVGNADREPGVRVAVVMDLKNRILAPATRLNQYFTAPPESTFAVKMAKEFEKGRESGSFTVARGDVVVWVEPVRVLNTSLGKNVVIAMALVSIDAGLAMPGVGAIGVTYSKVLIFTAILGGLFLLILYRLTLKPFEILNQDLDRALKGEISKLKPDFKFSEVQPLWDLANSAIQRIPKDASGLSMDLSQEMRSTAKEDFVVVMEMLGKISSFGVVFCDENRKILSINKKFEELSGIHGHNTEGQELSSVARDQALVALCNDLFDRVRAGSAPIQEEFDFGGIAYQVVASAIGTHHLKGYVFAFMRQEGSVVR